MAPCAVAGGVQSNPYVHEPVRNLLALYPAELCSMYWSGIVAGQACVFPGTKSTSRLGKRLEAAHIRKVLTSVDWKDPPTIAVLLAKRAVNWNPQACWVIAGSEIVTIRCCLIPGT